MRAYLTDQARQHAFRLGLLRNCAARRYRANENGLARFWLFEAVSVAGRGNARVRDPRHVDGDRFSERHEMDHR